jgi:TPR repeat protein
MGHGTKKNLQEAVRIFQEAINLGSSNASLNLGICYENGYGVQNNVQ